MNKNPSHNGFVKYKVAINPLRNVHMHKRREEQAFLSIIFIYSYNKAQRSIAFSFRLIDGDLDFGGKERKNCIHK